MTDYTDLLTRLDNLAGCQAYEAANASEAIRQLIAERDAAFAMSKCECESNEACRNLVALHDEVTYLEKCVASHEKDKCSAQESFGKCFTENQKLHKEIATLKSELREASGVLCNCEEAFEESRDYPLTLKDVREAIATINAALGSE